MLPFHFLRTGDRIGRAVVKILRADGAAGTGFLVAPGIVLTNHHVLPDADTAASARAFANYEAVGPTGPAGQLAIAALRPDELFFNDEDLDFTFCGVEGLDDLGVVVLDRDSLNILPLEAVNIVQHPRGRPKEVALQDNRVVKVDNVVVHYSCDTEPGSSGSPVFNNQWQLVALHHASVVADDTDGRPARGADPRSRFLNEGIRISAIAVWLEMAEADTPARQSQLERLRRIVRGLDPQIGFFGVLGRPHNGRSSAEKVVECYRADSGDLDVAYWDLSSLAPNPFTYLTEIGWVVAGMRVDIWCLAHVRHDVLLALCLHLETHFRLDYDYIVDPGRPASNVAVLYRRTGLVSIEWLRPSREDDDSGTVADETGAAANRLHVHASDGRGGAVDLMLVPVARSRRTRKPRIVPVDAATTTAASWLYIGNGLTERDVRTLSEGGTTVRAASGPDGAIALCDGPDSPFPTIFVSSNLERTRGTSGSLVVATHRDWPDALTILGPARPIVVRLPFATAGPLTTRPDPTPAPELAPEPEPPGTHGFGVGPRPPTDHPRQPPAGASSTRNPRHLRGRVHPPRHGTEQ